MGEEKKEPFRFKFTMTEEQRQLTAKLRELEEVNTYYKTTTMTDKEDRKTGEVLKEIERDVTVGRPILQGFKVGEKVIISFGGYFEYQFDVAFIRRILGKLEANPDMKFCIDAGNDIFVKNSEMVRIINEAVTAMNEKGITIEDDYSKDFRKTDMGKMLDGMGLI